MILYLNKYFDNYMIIKLKKFIIHIYNIYVYIHIYVYINLYVNIFINISVCIHMYEYISICIYI